MQRAPCALPRILVLIICYLAQCMAPWPARRVEQDLVATLGEQRGPGLRQSTMADHSHSIALLGSWVGVRRLFHISLFLTAYRMVLTKILVVGTMADQSTPPFAVRQRGFPLHRARRIIVGGTAALKASLKAH